MEPPGRACVSTPFEGEGAGTQGGGVSANTTVSTYKWLPGSPAIKHTRGQVELISSLPLESQFLYFSSSGNVVSALTLTERP